MLWVRLDRPGFPVLSAFEDDACRNEVAVGNGGGVAEGQGVFVNGLDGTPDL